MEKRRNAFCIMGVGIKTDNHQQLFFVITLNLGAVGAWGRDF